MKTNYLLAIFFGLITTSSSSFASIEIANNLLFSAFGSTSVTKTNNKTPLFINREITDKTSYDSDTTLGLQLDYHFLDHFSSSLQVLKAPQDEWSEPKVEWLYADYDYNQFSTKIGRLRLPIFLGSEYAYAAQLFVPARPPQTAYDSVMGITSYDGMNFTWNQELNDDMSLAVSPYVSFTGKPKALKGDTLIQFKIHKLLGMAIDLSSINYRIHFSSGYADYNFAVYENGTNIQPATRDTMRFYSLGGEYNLNDLNLKSEVFINNQQTLSWYSQVAYNYKILTPYINYGQKHAKTQRGNDDDSQIITTGIRFDVTANISINTEYQYTKLDKNKDASGMFITKPGRAPEKPDASVYTLMVNFIL